MRDGVVVYLILPALRPLYGGRRTFKFSVPHWSTENRFVSPVPSLSPSVPEPGFVADDPVCVSWDCARQGPWGLRALGPPGRAPGRGRVRGVYSCL